MRLLRTGSLVLGVIVVVSTSQCLEIVARKRFSRKL